MTCFIFFDFGVFLLKISYLLQLKSFLAFMDRSKFFIFQISLQFHRIYFYFHWSIFFLFQISLQFHLICFYFRWSIFSIYQILLQFHHIFFIPVGVHSLFFKFYSNPPHLFLFPLEYIFLSLTNCSKSHIPPA